MHLCWTHSDVVRQRQSAAPLRWSHRTSESLQQRLSIAVGDWEYRNLRDGLGIFPAQTFGLWRGANSGSERIAGIPHEVHHAATLHTIFRTHWSIGEYRLFEITIVARVGIDEASNRAMLICDLRLY